MMDSFITGFGNMFNSSLNGQKIGTNEISI